MFSIRKTLKRLYRKHIYGDLMSLSPIEVGSIITSIATLVGVIIAFAKLYWEQQKAKKDIELSKQYLKTLSRLVYEREKLEREKLEWRKLEGIGKALGWILNRTEYEEEEEYDA